MKRIVIFSLLLSLFALSFSVPVQAEDNMGNVNNEEE